MAYITLEISISFSFHSYSFNKKSVQDFTISDTGDAALYFQHDEKCFTCLQAVESVEIRVAYSSTLAS